jgi:hypothetical protein
MKSTKLMLGTMVLSLGMAGAAWAQPAPSHDRDAAVRGGYANDRYYVNRARGDRDDVYRGWYNPYAYRRGDGDHDRDDRSLWNFRGDRDHRNVWRGSWNWGHNDVRRGKSHDR